MAWRRYDACQEPPLWASPAKRSARRVKACPAAVVAFQRSSSRSQAARHTRGRGASAMLGHAGVQCDRSSGLEADVVLLLVAIGVQHVCQHASGGFLPAGSGAAARAPLSLG